VHSLNATLLHLFHDSSCLKSGQGLKYHQLQLVVQAQCVAAKKRQRLYFKFITSISFTLCLNCYYPSHLFNLKQYTVLNDFKLSTSFLVPDDLNYTA